MRGTGRALGNVARQIPCEPGSAVRRGSQGGAERFAHLSHVHIKGGYHLDVARLIAADFLLNESLVSALPVVVETLHERAGAISQADDGQSNF